MDKCSICGGDVTKSLTSPDTRFDKTPNKKFSLYECVDCGHGETYPTPDDLTDYYFSEYYSQLMGDNGILERLLSLYGDMVGIKSLLPENTGEILVVGCGPGEKVSNISEIGWEPTCVEMDKEAVEIARNKFSLEVHHGTLSDTSDKLNSNQFDVVLFDHVFEHIQNPRSNLEIVKRVLKPGGYLIIEVPNFSSWNRRIFQTSWGDHDVPRHLHHYTPRSLNMLVAEFNFALDRDSFDGRARLPAGWFTDTIENRHGVNIPTLIVYPFFIPYGIVSKFFGASRFRHRYKLM